MQIIKVALIILSVLMSSAVYRYTISQYGSVAISISMSILFVALFMTIVLYVLRLIRKRGVEE